MEWQRLSDELREDERPRATLPGMVGGGFEYECDQCSWDLTQ